MERLTKAQFEECKKEFTALGESALYLNHYQLAAQTHVKDAIIWKLFLTDPQMADYINSEMNLIRTASINDIIHRAPNSKSVGQAQLINALTKIDEMAQNKQGPVFIYTYVPLNAEQKFAPNVALNEFEQIEEEESKEKENPLEGIEIPTEIPAR